MLFSSTTFLFAFLPIVLITYYIVPRITRNLVLFIFSLVFYAWGEPVYIVLMIASTIVAYITGLLADKQRKSAKKYTPLIAMIGAVVWNIGLLLFFKYTDFFIGAANSIFGTQIKTLGLALPIGISFYSFQTLSYVIDVYKGEVRSQKNFLDLATYVALFPQLIAGPIVRYIDVAEQLKKRNESIEHFAQGVWRFSIGLGKKVILANTIGELFDTISNSAQSELSVAASWLGIIAYTFQIYFDFSGYSDMAIGLGKMFGFDFLENFNYPYISTSITDFWRRWHMSLSSWFRDYVYIPLGGNRVSLPRQILNLFIVWGLTGLWHGASWNFVIWGLYYFVFLCLEKFVFKKFLDKIPKIIRWVYSMFVVLVGWMIFYFEDFSAMKSAFSVAFGASGNAFTDPVMNAMIINNIPFIIIAAIACAPVAKLVKVGIAKLKQRAPVTEPIFNTVFNVVMLVLCVASLAGSTYNPFLYFRF